MEVGLEGTEVGGQSSLQQEEVEEEEEASEEEEESPGVAGFVCPVLCRCCCWFLEDFGFGQCCWAGLGLILCVQSRVQRSPLQ